MKKSIPRKIAQKNSDQKTMVKPVNKIKKKLRQNGGTVLIAGFPGPGLVGPIATNYLIEQLHLHQIAYVESEFIMPGVMFIGGKLRHPFRLYSDNKGEICVLVCDAPIYIAGVHSVLDAVVNWAIDSKITDVIVLEGIAVEGILDSGRKPVLFSSNEEVSDDDGYLRYMGKDRISDTGHDRGNINTAFVTGISGGLLASCLSNGISCKGLFIPASSGIPDPEGAAILIDGLNNLHNLSFKVESTALKEQGSELKKKIEEMLKSINKQRNQHQQENIVSTDQSMYG